LYLIPANSDTVIDLKVWGIEEALSTSTGTSVANPFRKWIRPAIRENPFMVFVVKKDQWEIVGLDSTGDIAEVWRASVARTPVTERILNVERDLWRGRALSAGVPPSVFIDALSRFDTPDSLPAVRSIHADREGNVWIARFDGLGQSLPRHYDVFNAAGLWLGTVSLPEGVGRLLEVGSEHILALHTDEFGVHYVRDYAIRKGAG
jgi:hypothetical protein